ncbi:MAG: DUF1622 domain-containing protein [Hyphomicrobiaceae bacterium]|nr:DUF1622 domain-containing protein [Hyphomicrobiaceae bacterium]
MDALVLLVGTSTRLLEAGGVIVIVAGVLVASVRYAMAVRRAGPDPFRGYRRDLGRVILLGLELFVAADIIRTVALTPTLESVAALGGIVLIRTFLSMSIQVELEGAWPWHRRAMDERARSGP